MQKLPKHQDLDSRILEVPRPMALFWRVVIACSIFVVGTVLVILAGLKVAGINISWPAFCYVPLLALAAFVLLPTTFKLWQFLTAVLNMLVMTAEAWGKRAGFSIDLNRDGYIGYYHPKPVQVEERRPIPFNSPKGQKLLTSEVPNVLEQQQTDQATAPPITRRLVILPNNEKVPVETIERVLIQIFQQGRGIGRKDWCPSILDREIYDGLWSLFVSCGIIVDRKPKSSGKLGVESLEQAREAMGDVLQI